MKWKKFSIATTTEAIDFISDMLNEIGVEGIEIEDNVPLSEADTKGMFIDILPELPPDDGSARVNFYLSADEETHNATFQCGDAPRSVEEPDLSEEELLARVREGLEEVKLFCQAGSCEITRSETEDKDWMNAWKDYFHSFTVENILIHPTWEEVSEEDLGKICVTIEPGSAFGTGTHETTQLCLKQLSKYLQPGMEVLDVGTGSGILGITAMKMGAVHCLGTELDEGAIINIQDNASLNDLSDEQFHVIYGNILDDPAVQDEVGYEKYDLVLANILAPVIVMLTGEVARHMKKGAVIITSGIVDEKEKDVVEAFEANAEFEILEITHQNDWVSVTAKKIG